MASKKCKVTVAKDDRGNYKVESRGACQEFEIARATNVASISNFAANLGGAIDSWEEEHVKDYSMKAVHQVKLPAKMPVDAFVGKDYIQLTARDASNVAWSAMLSREPQVPGKSTYNQIAAIGKNIDASIHSPRDDSAKAYIKAVTGMLQYVEIHDLSHPDFARGEKIPATDQFVFFNDEERKNPSP